jgi:hypothetical protein
LNERIAENLALWSAKHRKIRGKPLSFDEHKYLRGIYEDRHPFIVVRKSAQCGVSEWLMNIAFWLADSYGLNSTVVQPADPELGSFVHGRVNPAIADCEYLLSKLTATDNVGLKKIGRGFIYFRGSRKPHKLKTIDSDCMLYDELDELTEGTIARGEKRLGHSTLKWQRAVSTPTYPEEGIDKLYQESNQMQWFIPCQHCGLKQTLTFEHNVDIETEKVICRGCKKEIDRLGDGEWVATYPERPIHGYHINKLFCAFTDIHKLIENSQSIAQFEIQEFYNSDLGLPYAAKGNRMAKSDLRACVDPSYQAPTPADHCTMGVDVGTVLNVKISELQDGKRRAVHICALNTFEELDELMENYNVDICVIDANPETRKAKEFQSRFLGRVYLAYYWPSDDKRKELLEIAEDEEEGADVVKINRTQAGDYIVGEYQHRRVILPSNAEYIPQFFTQMVAPLRVVEKGPDGNEVAKYKEFGKPDHYFHADIYDFIANKINEEGSMIFLKDSVQGLEREMHKMAMISGIERQDTHDVGAGLRDTAMENMDDL